LIAGILGSVTVAVLDLPAIATADGACLVALLVVGGLWAIRRG
jgi:MYXO-CTERM domain-containing protein